ncbi:MULTISPECIES: acetyl-CoA carboxylase biotin carboxylase subunit family protein [unclassified Streptomyces]|uniref:ATP-grasp domain-containing protein n=1 Tax=unclassified Streptomyces TaxID=2593676 RepID=UPI001F1EC3C6|nr:MULTISPECIES: ATP-grasp domain-containing protein [unclassified Streptomyces]
MNADTRPSVACVSGRRIVDVLNDLDVRSVLLDDPTPLDLACQVDVPLDIDLEDWDAAEAALRWLHASRPFDAVLSVYDAHLPLASYLAARLGTRGLDLRAALACHDKIRMRMALAAGGVRVPDHLPAVDPADAAATAQHLGLPVVIKKATGSRGRGSMLCRSTEDVARAVETLSPAALLVERAVEGPEYAVQSITSNSRTTVVSVLAQHVGPGPRQAETGYDYPSGLDTEREAEITAFVTRALAVLGFDHAVSHTQIRLDEDGPVLINVAGRPPGGQLCAATESVSGIDLTRAAAEIALGIPVSRAVPTASRVLYRCVTSDSPGTAWYDLAGIDAPAVTLDIEPGDSVRSVDDPQGGSYGRIVVYGDDPAELESRYRAIFNSLRLHVEPDNQQVILP